MKRQLMISGSSPCRVFAIITAALYVLLITLPVLIISVIAYTGLYLGSAFFVSWELNILIAMLNAYVLIFGIGSLVGAARSGSTLLPLAYTWIWHCLFQAALLIYISGIELVPDNEFLDFLAGMFIGLRKFILGGASQIAVCGIIALMLILCHCGAIKSKVLALLVTTVGFAVHIGIGIYMTAEVLPIAGAYAFISAILPWVYLIIIAGYILFYGPTLFTVLAMRRERLSAAKNMIGE